MRDLTGTDAGEGHLPLSALAGIEEDAKIVPQQHHSVVIALSRRHLTGRSEKDDFARGHCAHLLPLYATRGEKGRLRSCTAFSSPSSTAGVPLPASRFRPQQL